MCGFQTSNDPKLTPEREIDDHLRNIHPHWYYANDSEIEAQRFLTEAVEKSEA